MGDDDRSGTDASVPSLRPRGKIVIPDAFLRNSTNGSSRSVAPPAESPSRQGNGLRAAPIGPKVVAPTGVKPAVAPKAEPPKPSFNPISPGLSSVKLPLGPSPKEEGKSVRSDEVVRQRFCPRSRLYCCGCCRSTVDSCCTALDVHVGEGGCAVFTCYP